VLLLRAVPTGDPPQAWAIDIAVELPDGRRTDLGSVSPFPVGAAGTFTLPVPEIGREVLARDGGVLVAELKPASAEPLREPLTVEITMSWIPD
jgi:hypothetical protein